MFISKKSQGHIEIVLSFVLFVGFLLFVFLFIDPLSSSKTSDFEVEEVLTSLEKNLSGQVSVLSVVINKGGSCYDFPDSFNEDFIEVLVADRKFDLYFSDIFLTHSGKRVVNCPKSNYTLGAVLKKDFFVYEKIKSLNESYTDDYSALLESFGFFNDFSLFFSRRDGSVIKGLSMIKEPPRSVGVESIQRPVLMIDKEAKVYEVVLNLRVW